MKIASALNQNKQLHLQAIDFANKQIKLGVEIDAEIRRELLPKLLLKRSKRRVGSRIINL
jgi:hypothetical protein